MPAISQVLEIQYWVNQTESPVPVSNKGNSFVAKEMSMFLDHILSSLSRKVICLTRIFLNHNWTHQHRIILKISNKNNFTPTIPLFLCSSDTGHLFVFGFPKHFPFSGLLSFFFHLTGTICLISFCSEFGLNIISLERSYLFSPPQFQLVISIPVTLSHYSNDKFLKLCYLFICFLINSCTQNINYKKAKTFHESKSFLFTTVFQCIKEQPINFI